MQTTAAIERPCVSHLRVLMVGRLLMVGLVVALSVGALPNRAMADPADDAGTLASLVNQSRAEQGLGRLMPDRELQVIANRQAHLMAESGSIFHTGDLRSQLGGGWRTWAENVGYGPSAEWIHSAFMNSDHHSSNILDGAYNYVGIGVAYGGDGSVYVAEVFGAW